jgi:hypothetical protein
VNSVGEEVITADLTGGPRQGVEREPNAPLKVHGWAILTEPERLAGMSGIPAWTLQQLRSEVPDPRLTTVSGCSAAKLNSLLCLADSKYLLLEPERADGTPVATPMWFKYA